MVILVIVDPLGDYHPSDEVIGVGRSLVVGPNGIVSNGGRGQFRGRGRTNRPL